MGIVNRVLPLVLVAGWLSVSLLSGWATARAEDVLGQNVIGQDVFAGGDAAVLNGSDVWARINPEFYGFPTVSFAADLVVLGRNTPRAQPLLFDNLGNTLLGAGDFGNPTQAGARLNMTFFDHW